MNTSVVITGGAGFIGAHLVRYLHEVCNHDIVIIDKLSYAADLNRLRDVLPSPRVFFYHKDINDAAAVADILTQHQPQTIMHLAAESHVDRSILAPQVFLHNNTVGTQTLLQCCLSYWQGLPHGLQDAFRFLQVSTDEVFGDAQSNGTAANETAPYRPSSPYSASKAAADQWVWAYGRTYGLPMNISHCSNNYGAAQHPEKLIPLALSRWQNGQSVPVYGDGLQCRDWLHVSDHVRALWQIVTQAPPQQSYIVAAEQAVSNLQLLNLLYAAFCREQKRPVSSVISESIISEATVSESVLSAPIEFVDDRAGHDRSYLLDSRKIRRELGWQPRIGLQDGLTDTVRLSLPSHRKGTV